MLCRDARMNVLLHGKEKNCADFIMVASFASYSTLKNAKSSPALKQDCLNDQSKCCSRQFSQLRIAGSSTPFLRHFRVGMRRET